MHLFVGNRQAVTEQNWIKLSLDQAKKISASTSPKAGKSGIRVEYDAFRAAGSERRFLARAQPAAEKESADAPIRKDFVSASRQRQPALFENDSVVRYRQRTPRVLLDHQNRDTGLAQFDERPEQTGGHLPGKAHRRFIDQYQLRRQQQGAANLEHLLLTTAERGGLLSLPFPKYGETIHDLVHPASQQVSVPDGHAAQLQIVAVGKLGKQVAPLGHIGDAESEQRARLRGR